MALEVHPLWPLSPADGMRGTRDFDHHGAGEWPQDEIAMKPSNPSPGAGLEPGAFRELRDDPGRLALALQKKWSVPAITCMVERGNRRASVRISGVGLNWSASPDRRRTGRSNRLSASRAGSSGRARLDSATGGPISASASIRPRGGDDPCCRHVAGGHDTGPPPRRVALPAAGGRLRAPLRPPSRTGCPPCPTQRSSPASPPSWGRRSPRPLDGARGWRGLR